MSLPWKILGMVECTHNPRAQCKQPCNSSPTELRNIGNSWRKHPDVHFWLPHMGKHTLTHVCTYAHPHFKFSFYLIILVIFWLYIQIMNLFEFPCTMDGRQENIILFLKPQDLNNWWNNSMICKTRCCILNHANITGVLTPTKWKFSESVGGVLHW